MKSYVFISGATGGLGKAFAAECASRGWDLFLTDLDAGALTPAADGIERMYGVDVITAPCDLTDPAAREALLADIARRGIGFHFVFNVAGIDYQGPFDERRVDELRTILRLNVESTVEVTRGLLVHRDPTRPLYIVNVSSLAAFFPMPVKAVYAASKRFLLDWSLALDREMRPAGVTVTALCPAGMPTNESCVRGIAAQGLMGRITTVNVGDVAKLTVDRALAGRPVVVPGWVNQVMRYAGSLVPAPVVAGMIGRRWSKSHEKSHVAVQRRMVVAG
jgi:short-subunit dehydrogenase